MYTVRDAGGSILARGTMLNVFTRYDSDPARRRVTELPPELGLGSVPSRVIQVPRVEDLVDLARKPEFGDAQNHAWHYGQTDSNRHINGTVYLRVMEEFVADVLHEAGHDLKRLHAARARIVYRKPGFRGETYQRVAWFRSEAPLILAGAFYKGGDSMAEPPAVAIELTLLQHGESR